MSRNFKVMFAVLAVLIIAGTTYAFAAGNTVPATTVGDGLGVVSGYVITSPVYIQNVSDPSKLDSVGFNVGAAAAIVKVQLVATTGTWYGCDLNADTGSPTTDWVCDTTGLASSTIDQLRVVASSN